MARWAARSAGVGGGLLGLGGLDLVGQLLGPLEQRAGAPPASALAICAAERLLLGAQLVGAGDGGAAGSSAASSASTSDSSSPRARWEARTRRGRHGAAQVDHVARLLTARRGLSTGRRGRPVVRAYAPIGTWRKGAQMGRYAVDPRTLQRVDAQLETTVAHARAQLGALSVDMQALLRDGWRSPAAAAFAGGVAGLARGAVELLAALEEMGRAIALSANEYASTEDDVRTSMGES